MKLVAVLALLCCLAVGAWATPVPRSKLNDKVTIANVVQAEGRQAAAQPVASAAEDDDDDDDDDDDVDLDITGEDDDDDEEEEDDDDDDDYLERFIDDILGGDDDDDDDDDEVSSVVEPVGPGSPVQSGGSSQPIPAAVQADLAAANAANDADAVGDGSEVDVYSGSYDEDETGDVAPEGQAAAVIPDSSIEAAEPVVNAVAQAPSVVAAAPSSDEDEDDEDDDDDDDDVDLDLTEDDDDDDDEADDDDDDDEDDEDEVDGIADIAGARRARGIETHNAGDVSAIYVSKYNRFVDNILGRINKILRANYDPVTVKLTNPNSNSKSNKNKTKKIVKRKRTKSGAVKNTATVVKSTNDERANDIKNSMDAVESTETFIKVATTMANEFATTIVVDSTESPKTRTATNHRVSRAKKNKTRNKTKTGHNKITTPSSTDKNKTKQKKSKPRAKATLYGLASLQRAGDVSVNMMSDHTTIKTKFNLGPLTLKVEKEFGRAAKKELRSATATTAEMSGRLSLRVLHGGAATLHSIRVLQPKQVRVESADDHDRTREFVWKRSSHIAHLVSQKLSSATRSMLRPPPAQAA